ncbi:MAG: hypothetical protein AVDCRST_MAG02-3301 [uncultured Rubrobacteraceae bacterium]|uniref:DUF4179 domain-containing protein n=1 Tax=uncultured Rubrobacteraceae bacterium TaxID=349277 RepID=A0A6J4RAQ4_9ACTN|nr:MAG: hypothetical protein AVDCRST_MAG02-3301 [uncultured Rubrobacteraceae bacterium]
MSEQRRRLEGALRRCAERGAPADTVDLWPAVRERVSGTRVEGTTTDGERTEGVRAGSGVRRSLRPVQAPLALALAALSVLILGLIVFAASGPVGDLVENGPPGPGAPDPREATNQERSDGSAGGEGVADRLFANYLPGGEGTPPGEKVGQTQTADGAEVTLERAYADEDVVVVGIEARDLDGPQKLEERGPDYGPVFLQPLLIGEEGETAADLPPRVDITDAGGEDYDNIDGTTQYPGAAVVFEAPEGLEAGREHRFRLEVPLFEGGMPGEKPDAGPFVFDFEIPVRTNPVVEVGQEATKGGVAITLERVVNSPSRPQAVVCFDPPDEYHEWRPSTAPTGFQREEPLPVRRLGGGCWSLTLEEPVEGRSSVTVTELFGYPRTAQAAQEDEDGKQIRGPWTFEFEAPDP